MKRAGSAAVIKSVPTKNRDYACLLLSLYTYSVKQVMRRITGLTMEEINRQWYLWSYRIEREEIMKDLLDLLHRLIDSRPLTEMEQALGHEIVHRARAIAGDEAEQLVKDLNDKMAAPAQTPAPAGPEDGKATEPEGEKQ